jgi:uncharacterized protein (TIGR03083 family)
MLSDKTPTTPIPVLVPFPFPTPTAPSTTPATAIPTLLPTPRHLDAIRAGVAALSEHAVEAGWDAPVPTCPGWTVANLVAHQGLVHRWAARGLRGEDAGDIGSDEELLETLPRAELLAWLSDGAAELLDTLTTAPDDAEGVVFLDDAPPARAFWARRQAHDVTIYAVDALAARLGRLPTTEEAGIATDLAVDGIDELLRGFLTRHPTALADDDRFTIAVRPTDADVGWLMRVRKRKIVTGRVRVHSETPNAQEDPADAVFTGTAAQLYLGLWNRGDEITAEGRASALERWREAQQAR